MQVISQRALGIYHMSPPCPAAWDCEADGKTPKKAFEEHALLEVCSDNRHCEDPIVAALETHWLTSKGARLLRTACRRSLSHQFIVGEDPRGTFATDALLRGVSRSWGDNWSLAAAPAPAAVEAPAAEADVPDTTAADAADAKKGGNGGSRFFAGIPGNCFPGEATVLVAAAAGDAPRRGSSGPAVASDVAVADLRVGDLVLAERRQGGLAFEPVLGFLHVVRGQPREFLRVVHEFGQFRASPGHIVFVAAEGGRQDKAVQELRAGDVLLAAPPGLPPGAPRPSRVLSVGRGVSTAGMYAPLTASGTIVVDAVLASNYAVPLPGLRLPHWLAHLALLPARAAHALRRQARPAPWPGPPRGARGAAAEAGEGAPAEPGEGLHPVPDFLCRRVGALWLLRAVQPALAALS